MDCEVVGMPSLAFGGRKNPTALLLCSASFQAQTLMWVSCKLLLPVPPHAVGVGALREAQVGKQQALLFYKERKNQSQMWHSCHLSQCVFKAWNSVAFSMMQPGCFSVIALNSHHSLLPLTGDVSKIDWSKCGTESVDLYFSVLILITAQCTALFNFCLNI